MKKRYVLAALAALVVLSGCKDKSSTENTDTQNTQSNEEAASMDEDQLSELDPEFSQDLENNEEIDAEDEEEEETALDPITPSDYLVKNASDYATLGDYSDVEVTKYIYEITDDMVQEEIQEELEGFSEEESTNAPSQAGNLVYINLTSSVDGKTGDEEETFITLGQEEYGAEFDEKLTGVSTGDELEFSIAYGDDTWQEEWQGKTVEFKVEVTDVTTSNTPEYNDDYVKNYTDFDTKEAYEASVKEYLQQTYEEQSTYEAEEDLLTACVAKTEFTGEYPDELFSSCKEEVLSGYTMFMEDGEDISDVLEMFGVSESDVEEEAKNLVNRRLFIAAYVQANNVEVSEEEYVDYVKEYAAYYGETAADFEALYTRETIVNALYESKVTGLLMEQAKVTEVPYTADTYGDEESDDAENIDDMEMVEEGEEGIGE